LLCDAPAELAFQYSYDNCLPRRITLTTYSRQADSAVVQHQLAEAALKIDSAWLQVTHAAAEVEDTAVAGMQMEYIARARVRSVVGYAVKLVR
jgi:3-hydroxy-9,10-secoandrosta-1,3,5(10)-triene-9,17-dione monooxygenase